MTETVHHRQARCPCGTNHKPSEPEDLRLVRILARDKQGARLSLIDDRAEERDSRIEIHFIPRGESPRATYICEMHHATGVLRRAMRFAILQTALRRGLHTINIKESSRDDNSNDSSLPSESRIIEIERETKLMFQEDDELAPFRQWLMDAPDDWQACMLLSNAYWTRTQVRVLASPRFRKLTRDLVLGRFKPDFPSFPEALLSVEFLGYWELAGCLASQFGPGLSEVEVSIGERLEIQLADRSNTISISHRDQDRFPIHLLRSSIKRRLQGTVANS